MLHLKQYARRDSQKQQKPKGDPGKLAFTGPEAVVPLAALALTFLSAGSGLMWLGRKRDDE